MTSFGPLPSLTELAKFRGRLPCRCLRHWHEGAKTRVADPRWPSGTQPGEGQTGKQETGPAASAASDSAGEMGHSVSLLELFSLM